MKRESNLLQRLHVTFVFIYRCVCVCVCVLKLILVYGQVAQYFRNNSFLLLKYMRFLQHSPTATTLSDTFHYKYTSPDLTVRIGSTWPTKPKAKRSKVQAFLPK